MHFFKLLKPFVLIFLVSAWVFLLCVAVIPVLALNDFCVLLRVVFLDPCATFFLAFRTISWMIFAPFSCILDFLFAVGIVPGFTRLALDFLLAWLRNPACGASALLRSAFFAVVVALVAFFLLFLVTGLLSFVRVVAFEVRFGGGLRHLSFYGLVCDSLHLFA